MSPRLLVLLQLLACNIAAAQFSISIDGRKDAWYSNRNTLTESYVHLACSDFIPLSGPKPDDESDLSADVWVAWNEKYFYLYAEVKDDVVRVGSAVRPWNDCIELKFDPDPAKKPLTGIVNARLSALDSTEATSLRGVDNLYPERDSLLSRKAASPGNYARRRTPDGYALELRLEWEWIACKGRAVRVGVGEEFGLAVNFHDNDGVSKRLGAIERDGTIQWSAGMADEVWLVPQLLGTVEFRPNHMLRFVRRNAIDTSDCRATTFLSAEAFRSRPGFPVIIENWRYHQGDTFDWAKPSFDDPSWEVTYARITKQQKPEGNWSGIGWFRARIVVDSSLWSVPLGFLVDHGGACEVYLDGDLLYSFGNVAVGGSVEQSFIERNPRILLFRQGRDHLLAIRYSNASSDKIVDLGGNAGFACILTGDLNQTIQKRADQVRDLTLAQFLFPVVAFVLGALHLFLFLFLPRPKENLYFALFMLCWGAFIWLSYQRTFFTSAEDILNSAKATGALLGGAIVFVLLTIYARFLSRIPPIGYGFVSICVGFAIGGFVLSLSEVTAQYLAYALIGLATLEVFRIFVTAGWERWRERWIAALGFTVFMLSLFYQVLIELSIVTPLWGVGVIIVGTLALSACFSIDLSRNFARTSKNLEKQLIQVQHLSSKAVENERIAKEEELSRRMLEADNARKTRELEEARQVQLSMLPKELPKIPHIDMAVKMETATEVGGDYYDFHLGEDGTLTIALGDATGHGAKAGTMVSVTKGLFHEFAPLSSFQTIFERFTRAIKCMNLGQLYMALLLVRVKDHTITASSAGMPPILIFRSSTGVVEQLVMKGMPLGGFMDFPYQTKEATLGSGDVVLLMSDGLLEMFNANDETLDEPRTVESFREIADQSPHEIIRHLLEKGKAWAGGRPQVDDVTFVVMKMT
jgi:serine phosphatase RsbU (regulator of sigma subunit)